MTGRGSADRHPCSSSAHSCDRSRVAGIAFASPATTAPTSSGAHRRVTDMLVILFVTMLPLLLTVPLVEVSADALADGTWLVALYNATNGPSWTSSCRTNWNIANPGSVCSAAWSRVTCSSNVVTTVVLNNCNLRGGPLPDIIGTSLSSLQTLQMYSNSLTGTLPPSFSSLSSLQYLWLHYNSLTGTLPPSFGNLSSLRELLLVSNSLTGTIPSSFSSLSSLWALFLQYNSLTGTLPSSWYTLRPYSGGNCNVQPWGTFSSCYNVSSNYFTGDIPSSWLWSNATIRGGFFTRNCLNVSNITAVMATGRFDTSGTPRSNASVCAAVAAAQSAAKVVTRSSSASVSATESDSGSASMSRGASLSLSPLMTMTGSASKSKSRSRRYFLASESESNSLSVSRLTSLSWSAYGSATGSLSPLMTITGSASKSKSRSSASESESNSLSVSRLTSLSWSAYGSATGSLSPLMTITGSASKSKSRSSASESESNSLSVSPLAATITLSVSASRSMSNTSPFVSTSVTSSATVSVGSGSVTMVARHPLTESLLSSPSPPVPSTSVSVSSSDCGEMPVCWVRQAATSTTTCHGCTFLDPGLETVLPPTLFPAASAVGAVVFAKVSREALGRATASLGSLQVVVECTRPRFLQLVNRSTATLDVVVVASAAGSGSEGRLAVLQLSTGARQQSGDGGGWLRWSTQQQQSLYRPFTMELPLAAECGDRLVTVTLAVLVTPVPLPQLAVGGAVQATDRATTWLGAIGGGASSGGSASRVAAVRSLLLCSKEGASTGGLLGLSLPRPSDDDNDDGVLLASARGAIVGNTVVLVVWLVVLLALAGVYHYRVSLPAAACVVRVALPSSLLPVCSALLPSLSGGVLILLAAGRTRLDAVDILVLVAGCCVLIGVLLPLLWLCAPSFATSTLNATTVVVSLLSGGEGGEHGSSSSRWLDVVVVDDGNPLKEKHPLRCLGGALLLWRRAVKPRWMWRPCPETKNDKSDRDARSIEPLCDSSLAARACDVILVEHRCLWYAALDMWSLCAAGLLGAASGVIDSSSVCSGAAIALTALFLLQFAVVVAVRPLTSVFANVHAAFVLLLTGLGTALQAGSIAGQSGSTSSSGGAAVEYWALLGAAVCGFLVAGASLMRVALMDAPHTVGVVRKFFLDLVSGGLNGLAVAEQDELKRCCRCPPTSPQRESEVCMPDDEALLEGVDALNRTFWDDVTGEVRLLKQDNDDDDVSMDELLGGVGAISAGGMEYGDGSGEEIREGGEALLLRFRV